MYLDYYNKTIAAGVIHLFLRRLFLLVGFNQLAHRLVL